MQSAFSAVLLKAAQQAGEYVAFVQGFGYVFFTSAEINADGARDFVKLHVTDKYKEKLPIRPTFINGVEVNLAHILLVAEGPFSNW